MSEPLALLTAKSICLFVVICTDSRDKYGRYLTDLFYLPGATHPADVLRDGLFLNLELIDRGLARPYTP